MDQHQQLLNLKGGESVIIGKTKWQKGEDKRLYYNSQGNAVIILPPPPPVPGKKTD